MIFAYKTHNDHLKDYQTAISQVEKKAVAVTYFESYAAIVNSEMEKKLTEESRTREYPPLLTASDVAEILSCHKTTAYEIMKDPHRPVWKHGKTVRLHRDLFFKQLEEEAMPKDQREDLK